MDRTDGWASGWASGWARRYLASAHPGLLDQLLDSVVQIVAVSDF